MKPLTIDELKALEMGDWVWIEDFQRTKSPVCGYGHYVRKCITYNTSVFEFGTSGRSYEYNVSDYGKKWVAYKNKEQAEARGEIIELPCNVGDLFYGVIATDIFLCVVRQVKIHKGSVLLSSDNWFYDFTYGYDAFMTREEAEAGLNKIRERIFGGGK